MELLSALDVRKGISARLVQRVRIEACPLVIHIEQVSVLQSSEPALTTLSHGLCAADKSRVLLHLIVKHLR